MYAIKSKFTANHIIVRFAVNMGSGANSALVGKFFLFFLKLSQINSKCHFSILHHISYYGTGLQVDSNSGEGCAGFSEKAFDLCKT